MTKKMNAEQKAFMHDLYEMVKSCGYIISWINNGTGIWARRSRYEKFVVMLISNSFVYDDLKGGRIVLLQKPHDIFLRIV